MIRRTTSILATRPALFALIIFMSGCGGEPPAGGAAGGAPASGLGRSPAPPGAVVFIVSPQDGATVGSPLDVKFGISGINIAPAGTHDPDTGHHHLIIDAELPDPGLPVPTDAQHVHFGKGQTEATVELAPGRHTLQLVLGDGNHVPHEPPIVSQVVTITVE